MDTSPNDELLRKQIAQLHQISLWSYRGAAALAALMLPLWLWLNDPFIGEVFVVACAIVFITLVIMRLLAYRLLRPVVVLINALICLLGLLLLHYSLLALPIVVLYPLLMFLISANFVPRNQLKWLMLVVMVLSSVLLGVYIAIDTAVAQADLSPLVLAPSVLVTQAVIILIACQSQLHLWNMFTRAQNMHVSLQDTHKHLEATVRARTAELQTTVSLLQATLDVTTDGILVIDSAGQVVTSNRVLATMWHIPANIPINGDGRLLFESLLDQLRAPEQFLTRVQEIYSDTESVSHDLIVFTDGRRFEHTSLPQYIDGVSSGQVWSFRDITQQAHAERRSTILADLGQRLSAATDVASASQIIIGVADELLHWDSCYLDLFDEKTNTLDTIVCMDVIDGQRVVTPPPQIAMVGPLESQIIHKGALLVLRATEEHALRTLASFGDIARQSEALMFVPIRRGTVTIGVLSIQSYTPNAYTQDDLQTLQGLADHCGGALARILTQEALHEAEQEHQELERKMLETQKLESLGVLTGGIAHDFNNLLAVIVGNVDMARLDLAVDHPALESVQQIEIAARRATELIRQMLSYAGRSQRLIQPVEINSLVLELSNLLGASLPKHVRFMYELAPNLPALNGDATQLRQVVMNLLVNAADAIGAQPGLVHVRTGHGHVGRSYLDTLHFGAQLREGNYIYLEVRDNGCGMDASMISKIFEPFFSTKFTGRGLGLAAVLGIVRSHGGAIAVESTPGIGTLFRILLSPTTTSDMGMLAPQARDGAPWSGTGTVLIVDDEPTVCRIAVRFVERCGFRTISATDGATGVASFLANTEALAAVLLDVTMPGMSGTHALQQMHAIDPTVPVLLMSGYTEPDALIAGGDGVAAAFLHKPFQLEEVRAALRQATESRAQTHSVPLD